MRLFDGACASMALILRYCNSVHFKRSINILLLFASGCNQVLLLGTLKLLQKMTEHHLKLIHPVLQSLDGESWQKLNPFHPSIFRSLHLSKINYPFLHSVAQFWDSKNYVFRFNSFEICPLSEEFGAILGCPDVSSMQITVPIVSKPTEEIIQQQMARLFNIPPPLSLAHVSDNGIIFESFLKAAVAVNSNEVYWPRMVAFCIYAQFLLVSPSGDCNSKIMHIFD